MKFFYTLTSLLLCSLTLSAQKLVPLEYNTALLDRPEVEADRPARPKNLCTGLTRPDVTYVIAGDTSRLEIDIDTTGLGEDPGDYSCVNCDDLQFGTAAIEDDSLTYAADPGAVAGKEVVEVQFCNPNGCRSQFFHVIARRASLHTYVPAITVEAEALIQQEADPGQLPGPLSCASIFDCPDDYEGRDQQQYLTTYDTPVSTFNYLASRYAGIDSVCLVLCDTFTICDTFHYAFRVRQDTLTIPFMDDFSYTGPYPEASHWLDEDCFVNNDLATEPPSVGVATFDGLSRAGRPYGGGYGEADRLTSTYIDLKGISGDLFLSFWVQRRGLGDKPEPQDTLLLEFKNSENEWTFQRSFEGVPINQPNTIPEPFRFFTMEVPAEFRHSGFQFRFKNFSDRTGLLDVWHLDYVRLDQNEFDTTFSDIAFTEYPLPILRNYRNMPWRHFKGVESEALADSLTVHLFNHAEQALNADPSSVRIEERNTNVELFDVTLFNGQEANIPKGVPLIRQYSLIQDDSGFPSVWSDYLQIMQGPAFDNVEKPTFETTYQLSNFSQASDPGFEAVQRNDQVSYLTTFDNYFAYDDGTAEAGFIAGQDVQVAVRFTATVEDSLRAISLHIPHTTIDITDQRYNLKVWVGALDDEPEYERFLIEPVYANSVFDTLQGFSTYPLVDADGNFSPVYLPPGDFYIGWQQETNCSGTQCIPVGFDRNTPRAKSSIFYNANQGWQPLFPQFPGGALMLRPIVGSETPGFTSVEEPGAPFSSKIRAFPNPAREVLMIRLAEGRYEDHRYRLYAATGQLVQEGILAEQLNVGQLPAGLYWLHIYNPLTRETVTQKIAITH